MDGLSLKRRGGSGEVTDAQGQVRAPPGIRQHSDPASQPTGGLWALGCAGAPGAAAGIEARGQLGKPSPWHQTVAVTSNNFQEVSTKKAGWHTDYKIAETPARSLLPLLAPRRDRSEVRPQLGVY